MCEGQGLLDRCDEGSVHCFAGGRQIRVGPYQRPGVAKHMAGALQVTERVTHRLMGLRGGIGPQHLHGA